MSDTIEVSHCGECPLHHTMMDSGGALFEQCLREGRQIWPDDPERPEWCPLESAPVTIRLRPAKPEPSKRGHAIGEYGECVDWCDACRENRKRGFNPDGTERGS